MNYTKIIKLDKIDANINKIIRFTLDTPCMLIARWSMYTLCMLYGSTDTTSIQGLLI